MTNWRTPGLALAAAFCFALLVSCAAAPSNAPSTQQQSTGSILAGSTPAAGATVVAPVDELVLRFDPPARLDEVSVTGPDGMMPMMITPVGETSRYSIPLPGLGPGSYSVSWRATAAGRQQKGSFGFTVR